MDAQTVVLAMKIYDIAHLSKHNEYLEFPAEVPMPSNLQVEPVSHGSGIADKTSNDEIIEAWAQAMEAPSEKLGETLALLRIDSIVVQAGQVIGQHEPDREAACESLTEYFESTYWNQAGSINYQQS